MIVHIVWTIFLFTESQLLTVDITTAVGAFSEAYAERYKETRTKLLAGVAASEDSSVFSLDRFASGVGILYLFFLVIATGVYIFRQTLLVAAIKIGEKLCPNCCGPPDAELVEAAKEAELASGLDTYSRDFLADLRIETLADKYRKAVVDLHDAHQYEVDEQSMMN